VIGCLQVSMQSELLNLSRTKIKGLIADVIKYF